MAALLTEEEYLNLPEFVGRQEFRDGVLIELPPAKMSHAILVHKILEFLRSRIDKSRVWMEVGFQLRKGLWRIPDVCVHWPNQETKNDWCQGAPMVAIEVASRGNTPDELQEKVAEYLEFGATEVWVIDPKTRTMMVYFQNGAATLVAANQDYHSEALHLTIAPELRTFHGRS